LNVAVDEYEDKIIFLRKIKKGGASQSYGINVAKMAGIPQSVLIRANKLLLEFTNEKINLNYSVEKEWKDHKQVEMFDNNDNIIRDLKKIDVDKLTPIEAINKINELKSKL